MVAKSFIGALVAAALVSAQRDDKCSQTTITINSQGDASNLQSCSTLKGNVVIGNETGSALQLDGVKKIEGDLSLQDNAAIITLSSSSLETITGRFHLQNLARLSTLSFTKLSEVDRIEFQSLFQLERLTFGTPGVTKASQVTISDTDLNTLEGLDMTTVSLLNLNNNKRLSTYVSKLVNITSDLQIQANQQLKLDLPVLTTAANLTIADVSSFTMPLVQKVGSLRFDSSFFEVFLAPNLTESTGDVSFVANSALTNLSIPLLKTVGGGLTIANNTLLAKIDGLPKLEVVGAVKIRGNFSEVALPALRNARGTFDVLSTNNIEASCSTFSKQQRGQGGQIQGEFHCKGDEAGANEDTTPAGGNGGSSGSGGSSASGVFVNSAVLGLALVAGIMTSFL